MSHVKFKDPDPDGEGYATTEAIQLAEAELARNGEEIRPVTSASSGSTVVIDSFPEQEFLEQYPGRQLGRRRIPRQQGRGQYRYGLCWHR